ncbi:MAG TPA: hypothetical protein VGL20_09400 [Candidatus Dormibacteraeota bacterium]
MSARRAPRALRPGRRGARGQSLVMVALGGVALIGMTGLALDGGYEAGVYRSAQNGADAGALAAARFIYENQANPTYVTNNAICQTTAPNGVGPKQVYLNRSNATATCTGKTLTTYAPAGPDGFHSYGALATVDTSTGVSGVATLASHIGVNEATADVTANPTPTASGSVDITSLTASLSLLSNLLTSVNGSTTLFACSSSASGAGTSQTVPTAGGSCPGSGLSLSLLLSVLLVVNLNINVSTQLGLTGNIAAGPASISLVKQALSSVVPTSGMPQQRDFTRVVGAGLGVLGAVALNANVGTTSSITGNLGGDSTGVQTSVNIADLGATVAGTAISLSALDATARVSYDPVNGFQATTKCTLLSGEGAASIKIAGATLGINADCSYTPVGIPGVLSIGSTRTVNCQTGPNGQLCTASVCVLDINVLSVLAGVNSIDVCIGRAQASADFKPVTNTAGVIVTSQIPSPTFFLGVVGAHTVNPKAQAAATPRQVTDVSSDTFAAAPYAVPYAATEKSGGAAYCNLSFGPLVPGCNYTVWGAGMDGNSAIEKQLGCTPTGTQCWQGRLDPASSHAIGQTVTARSGSGTGPTALISGSKYILLPVISDEGVVQQYGLFAATADSHIFTLARTPDPVNSVVAPIAQATTTGAWMPNDEGAVSTKLVDPTYFNATGWS